MKRLLLIAVKVLLPLLVIFIAVLVVKGLIAKKPEQASQESPKIVPSLPVTTISRADHSPPVRTFGTVQSQFETIITPQLSGEITYVSPEFQVGQKVSEGAVLIRMDATDYQTSLAQAKYNLSVAKQALAEEQALSNQTKDDWLVSGRDLSKASDYALRKPQLEAANANIKAMSKALVKAEKDLERTILTAPFDAIVTVRTASLGSLATTQSQLGTLLSTEKVEVRIPLTVEQLKRVLLPSVEGAVPVEMFSPIIPNITWDGTFKRIDPVIDTKNQTLFGIAEVVAPYTQKERPLPVGAFVNVSVPAKKINDSFAVPETALVNDEVLWTVTQREEELFFLSKLAVNRVHSSGGVAYVLPTETPELTEIRIVTRPLTNFKEGGEIIPLDHK